MKLASLFSGGKDSMYSIYKAKQMGHSIECLITAFPKSSDSKLLHFPAIKLTELQSETMKIQQITSELNSDETVEQMNVLEILIEKAKKDFQIEGIVHGGISSKFQKKSFENICQKNNLEIITPLWMTNPKEYMNELINSGFKFILTSVSSDGLDESWLGKIISSSDLIKISNLSMEYGFNLNFEGGEAETLVIDCPLYSHPIQINKSEKIWDGYRGVLKIDDANLDYTLKQNNV
tara:strand:- start:138 stop:842 length:705 start_codon:yes stop_codon:yes gene_type:complete